MPQEELIEAGSRVTINKREYVIGKLAAQMLQGTLGLRREDPPVLRTSFVALQRSKGRAWARFTTDRVLRALGLID